MIQDYIFDGTVSLLPDVLAVNEWELDGGTDTDRPDSSTALAGCQRQCGNLINNRYTISCNTKPNQTIDKKQSLTAPPHCQCELNTVTKSHFTRTVFNYAFFAVIQSVAFQS